LRDGLSSAVVDAAGLKIRKLRYDTCSAARRRARIFLQGSLDADTGETK